MAKRDFLTVRDLSPEELADTLRVAAQMKARPRKFAGSLKGKALAMIFEKPSLRTRVTFDVGIQQLGGFAVCLSPWEISLGKRESVRDVARNLERIVQGIMIRTFAHEIAEEMAQHASVPVINGLTDFLHPVQALADYLTLQEAKGALKGRKLCFIGDGNNVAHSLMLAGAMLGVNVTVATPEGFEPKQRILKQAIEDAGASGATIAVTNNAGEGVKEADAVYTDVWASMGQEAQAGDRRAIFRPFQVNADLMAKAKPDAVFMHCLPAHRGEEVTDEVVDGPASVVFRQVENRLHTQKALMLRLMK